MLSQRKIRISVLPARTEGRMITERDAALGTGNCAFVGFVERPHVTSDRNVRRRTNLIRFFGRLVMRKYTAGSLVYIEDAVGNVAMVRPRRAPDCWTFPGGYHRRWPTETAESAACREAREELGLEIEDHIQPVVTYVQPNRGHYDHLFRVRLSTERPQIRRRRRLWTRIEVVEVEWHDLTDPDLWGSLIFEARVALRAFSDHLGLGLRDV